MRRTISKVFLFSCFESTTGRAVDSTRLIDVTLPRPCFYTVCLVLNL